MIKIDKNVFFGFLENFFFGVYKVSKEFFILFLEYYLINEYFIFII